jgi:hypothetical protein
VYIEGENGTVFLISADDEAVLVAVAAKGAKVGLMLFEVRRAAAVVAETLRVELAYETVEETPHAAPLQVVAPPEDEWDQPADDQPAYDHQHAYDQPAYYAQPLTDELVSDNHTGESADTPSWS